jgi:DNA-directed RNA polymerase subunit alpha
MEDMVEIDLTGLVLPERVETVQLSDDGRIGEFVIEPLERGYGHTLGNSVRRVLLSSLRGAAVWAFRVDGVVHEHQTIQGVAEDVHQVIQNLKSLVILLDDDVDEVTLEVKVKDAGAVTGANIAAKSGVNVLDLDHHILTLQEARSFRMELKVNKGRGFVLADQHAVEKSAPVDLIRIDSVYNPVRRANFQVLETRVGQRTDFDQLTFFIETDGSVSPEEALAMAGALVRKHLEYLLYFGKDGIPEGGGRDGVSRVPSGILDLISRPIEDLAELSVRSRNSLQKENIRTLGDLIQRTEDEMLKIENFGRKSLQEIEDFLAEHNLRFGMQVTRGSDGQLFFVDGEEAGASSSEDDEE